MNKPKEIAFTDISREVDSGVAGADALRADQLEQLIVARQAKETGLRREHARLTRKLGADHPRVTAIADRLTVNAGMRRDLTLESARAHTELPQVDATTWALLGVVRDKDLQGVPGVTVALYDRNGKWVEQLGYACTGENGQFRIEARNVGQVDGPVYVHVLSGQSVDLYADRAPLAPAGGKVDYREILLSRKGQAGTCPPPGGQQPGPTPVPEAWVVRGRVTDKEGKGLSGLTVSVFDRESLFVDRLGRAETDEDGNYQLTYPVSDFRDLIEKAPEIFVRVMDQSGNTLYTSKGPIRYEAGRVEVINVRVERRGKK
jgi:hypothetical protein